MNNTAALLLGVFTGAGAMFFTLIPRPVWTMVPLPVSGDSEQNEAAWKLNTVTGESRLCLIDGAGKMGCAPAIEANSLEELAGMRARTPN